MKSKMDLALQEVESWWGAYAENIWKETIEQNMINLTYSFFHILQELAQNYQLLLQQKRKGDARYICISYLRSGLLVHQNTHKIEILDNQYFEDWTECGLLWDNYFLFAPILDGIQEIENEYKKYSSYRQYILEDFIVEKSSVLLMRFSDTVKAIIENNLSLYQSIFASPSQVVYGEYRDQMKIIIKVG